jgi:hypothetical protein
LKIELKNDNDLKNDMPIQTVLVDYGSADSSISNVLHSPEDIESLPEAVYIHKAVNIRNDVGIDAVVVEGELYMSYILNECYVYFIAFLLMLTALLLILAFSILTIGTLLMIFDAIFNTKYAVENW